MPIENDSGDVSLCAVGDVAPNRDEPEKMFDLCKDALKGFDVKLFQMETNLSERGAPQIGSYGSLRVHPRNIEALKAAGFNVASYAGNHTLDWGPEAMIDTIDLLRGSGIGVVGAGRNIEEARRPVVMDVTGTKIAFLNYCTVLPNRFWATESVPGVAPLRIRTVYEMYLPHQPGCPARIFTYPYQEDLDAMLDDIRKAKSQADIVVLSLHWGLHFVRAKLAGYESPVAHAAIDAGADIIFGSHAHVLKGIDVYKGKVIFHNLGNFAVDSGLAKTWPNMTPGRRELLDEYQSEIDPAWGNIYPYPTDSRKTIIAKCLIANKRIRNVSFLPAVIDRSARPQVLSKKEEAFEEVFKYVTEITREAGLQTRYKVVEDEVIIQV